MAAPLKSQTGKAAGSFRALNENNRPRQASTHSSAQPPTAHEDAAGLFEHAPAGYMQLDGTGAIHRINQAGAALLGWPAHWLGGKPFVRWVVTSDKQLFHSHRQQALECGYCVSQQLRIKNRCGRQINVWLQSRREPPPGGDQGACRSVMVDVTAQRQSEQNSRQLQAQLIRVGRRHAAGELASSLAHELNQPLGTVMLNCETALAMLNAGASGECEFAESLTQATEAASYASELIRQLRSFVLPKEEQHRICSVDALIAEIKTLIDTDARDHDVALCVDVADDLPQVRVVAVEVEQVLVNLVHNAIEAIGEQLHPRRVTVRVSTDSQQHVRIAVKDNGPGLDRTATKRMFEPRFTTKTDGMGMGLAISRGIIEAHGGRLWAGNCAGEGACVQFTLPVDDGDEQ